MESGKKDRRSEVEEHLKGMDTEKLLKLVGWPNTQKELIDELLLSRGVSQEKIDELKRSAAAEIEINNAVDFSSIPVSPDLASFGYLFKFLLLIFVIDFSIAAFFWSSYGFKIGLGAAVVCAIVSLMLFPFLLSLCQRWGNESYQKQLDEAYKKARERLRR